MSKMIFKIVIDDNGYIEGRPIQCATKENAS